jgi:hypothetical protein
VSFPQLLFASIFHEYPRSAHDFVKSVNRYYPHSRVVYAVDHPGSRAGMQLLETRQALREHRRPYAKPVVRDRFLEGQGARLLERHRRTSWRNLHRYLFDVIEQIETEEFDYLVVADSDSMFTGSGLMELADGAWDFSSTVGEIGQWLHGRQFRQEWPAYEAIARHLGLAAKPADVGTMFALFVVSRRAVDALRPIIPRLEAHDEFRRLEELPGDFVFYEAFFPQLLSDLGMVARDVRVAVPGCRNRPYWRVEEYRPELWFYHPVSRLPSDPFRRLLARSRGGNMGRDHGG